MYDYFKKTEWILKAIFVKSNTDICKNEDIISKKLNQIKIVLFICYVFFGLFIFLRFTEIKKKMIGILFILFINIVKHVKIEDFIASSKGIIQVSNDLQVESSIFQKTIATFAGVIYVYNDVYKIVEINVSKSCFINCTSLEDSENGAAVFSGYGILTNGSDLTILKCAAQIDLNKGIFLISKGKLDDQWFKFILSNISRCLGSNNGGVIISYCQNVKNFIKYTNVESSVSAAVVELEAAIEKKILESNIINCSLKVISMKEYNVFDCFINNNKISDQPQEMGIFVNCFGDYHFGGVSIGGSSLNILVHKCFVQNPPQSCFCIQKRPITIIRRGALSLVSLLFHKCL